MSTSALPSKSASCWAKSIDFCAHNKCNSTTSKVLLFVSGLLFFGTGIYQFVLQASLQSYVLIGLGGTALTLAFALIGSSFVARALKSTKSGKEEEQAIANRSGNNLAENEPPLPKGQKKLSPLPPKSSSHLSGDPLRSAPEGTVREQTESKPRDRKGFHIAQLFSYSEFTNIKLVSKEEFSPSLKDPVVADFYFSLFEKFQTPLFRYKDHEGQQMIFLRFSIFDKQGQWVEDSFLRFVQTPDWEVKTFPLSQAGSDFSLHAKPEANSEENKWLKQLTGGERVPLINKGKISGHFFCSLWDPTKKREKSVVQQIFGSKVYAQGNIDNIKTSTFTFLDQIQHAAAIRREIPVLQGKLNQEDPFFLLQFKMSSNKVPFPSKTEGDGYIFFWQDTRFGNKWKMTLRLYNEKYWRMLLLIGGVPLTEVDNVFSAAFRFSSEMVDDLQPEEVKNLQELAAGNLVALGSFNLQI